jgi:hypothetical protein
MRQLSRYSDGLQAKRPEFDSWQGHDQTSSEAHQARGFFTGSKAAGARSIPLTDI